MDEKTEKFRRNNFRQRIVVICESCRLRRGFHGMIFEDEFSLFCRWCGNDGDDWYAVGKIFQLCCFMLFVGSSKH